MSDGNVSSLTKKCASCETVKSVSEFNAHHRGCRLRLYSQCRTCSAENNRRRYKRRVEAGGLHLPQRNARIKKLYGITSVDYDRMFAEQDGVCAICKSPSSVAGRNLSIDHCHSTRRVRGLLCQSCNVAIGHMKENPESLRAAADYLENSIKELHETRN